MKDSDAFNVALHGLHSCFVMLVMHQLLLLSCEEGFYRGVVPAIGFAAHRTNDAMFAQMFLKTLACVMLGLSSNYLAAIFHHALPDWALQSSLDARSATHISAVRDGSFQSP